MRRLLASDLLSFLVVLAGSVMARQAGSVDAPPQGVPPPPPAVALAFARTVKPFVAEYCYGCHGNKGEPKHGLNIEAFGSVASLVEHRDDWEQIASMLRQSAMFPIEEDQAEEDNRQAVADWLLEEFERIDRVTPRDPASSTTTRSATSSASTPGPPTTFGMDDSGYWFDNIADVLLLPPVLTEKYVTAADRTVRLALFGLRRSSRPWCACLPSRGASLRSAACPSSTTSPG